MAKSKISAPVGFFNAKRKPQNQTQEKLVFSFQEGKTYTRYVADNGNTMYSLKIQKDGVILKHVVGADGIVKSPKTDSEKVVFSQLFDYAQAAKQQNQTPTIYQSLGFSLELIPSGKFVTVEFITKAGELRKYNGRTGVKKYLKHSNIANAGRGDYFILWVRRGGVKFDSVAMIHKRRIVKLSAGGVVLWKNKSSRYTKTV